MSMKLHQLRRSYRVMGARLNASPDELKRAYRRLSYGPI